MAHSAGPHRGVATVAVDLWNWISANADGFNRDKTNTFDQLLPSLREDTHLDRCVDAGSGVR